MANNRMYLCCTHCEHGEFKTALYLGKRLGEGYYQHDHHVPTASDWASFYDRHELCGDGPPYWDHFEVRYECERE